MHLSRTAQHKQTRSFPISKGTTPFFFVPNSIGDIEGLDSLRWEDQQKIRKYVQGEAQTFEDDGGGGGGGGGAEDEEGGEFVVEYAKSNRSTCRGCETKINKDEVTALH